MRLPSHWRDYRLGGYAFVFRKLRFEALIGRHLTGGKVFVDFTADGLADAGHLHQILALLSRSVQRLGESQ